MVPATKPVKLLVNGVEVPLLVKELAIVGEVVVLQQTPCSVITVPPVAITIPPEVAVVEVMDDIAVVVTVGAMAGVVKLSSFP